MNAALAVGIGLGSVAAGYLSGGKIEYGLVPLGAAGLSVAFLLLAAPGLSLWAALVRLALLGFAGGFFIVPICALLQHRPDKSKKGEVLAAANLLSFVGVFLASGMHYLLAEVAHLSPSQIFLFGGVLTLAGAVYVVILLPDSLLRFVLWALTRTVYRIHVMGRDNIPAKGGALFVCNHVSIVDALLLLASTDRQVRFLMFKDYYELPYIKPFARILGVIPISSEQRPREMIQSLRTASDAIRAGEVVCIFAEGEITRIGHLLPFRRGFERIMKDVDAPIIPVALDGVWGSIFSFNKGRFLVENSAPPAVSRHDQLWHSDAAFRETVRSATGGAGTPGRGVAGPQKAHASASSVFDTNGPPASLSALPWRMRKIQRCGFGRC